MITSRNIINKVGPKPTKSKPEIGLVLKANICHKSKLKPAPNTYRWPYEKRYYGLSNFILDPFTKRKFNENSKIIQIEGNVAAGKEEFGRQLADELGMYYLPPIDLESYYVNRTGYDYRALNQFLPERLRICDWKMFHECPYRHSVIHMQTFLFKLRLFQYFHALRHVFNTGQGVVMSRSVFTERVFVEAMDNIGWLPKGYLRGDGVRFYDWKLRYNHIRNFTLSALLKPHLTIHLDTPIETCLERIKKDPDPKISQSQALTKEFLQYIDDAYKDVVLPKQEFNMHVMSVDHPKPKSREEILEIIDHIEELNFEPDPHETRFAEWDDLHFGWYFFHRRRFTTLVFLSDFVHHLNQRWYDIAGMGDSISFGDLLLRGTLYESHVGPFGYQQQYETNPLIHGYLKSFFKVPIKFNFSERVKDAMYTDFI